MRRRTRTMIVAVVTAVAVVVATVALLRSIRPARPSGCVVSSGGQQVPLDLEQAANAATIAAVGIRLGMPDHAVTIALAAALQESKLHNLDYGDRDSLGLFQQRPSQGWGTPAQVMNPDYAASAFFRKLARVRGWQQMPLADAAQAVQRSAGGYAYAGWETEARLLAIALTGETARGLTCHYSSVAAGGGTANDPRGSGASAESRLASELGAKAVGRPVGEKRGWQVATWLVAHAPAYGIVEVDFAGHRWRNDSGSWGPSPTPSASVTYRTAPAGNASAAVPLASARAWSRPRP